MADKQGDALHGNVVGGQDRHEGKARITLLAIRGVPILDAKLGA
jgi:hypothetical protein